MSSSGISKYVKVIDSLSCPLKDNMVLDMRRSIHSPRSRRRGQALLLAVLIMIFAALLSAAFIGIVAVNLNQTARQGDKNIARDAARAGLEYVNHQLTYSTLGDRWRPTLPTQLPYNYFTEFDRAQGWSGSFVKFPNPDGSTADGPQFLAKVERLDNSLLSLPGDPDYGRNDRFGSLRITVIGLSAEDPSAFHRTVAYKGGYIHSPVAQTMRTVSSFDFKRNEVLVAQGFPSNPDTAGTNDGTNATTPLLDVNLAKGDFKALGVPFTITLSDPRNGIPAQSAVVTEVRDNTPLAPERDKFTFVLAQPLPTGLATDTTRVELAANIGAPTRIDYNNEGTLGTGKTLVDSGIQFRFSDGVAGPNTEFVDGGRFNGGLVLSGDLLATKLRPISKSLVGTLISPPGSIQASGVIAMDNAAAVTVASVDGNVASQTLQRSSNSANGVFPTALDAEKNEVVSDGWNSIKGALPSDQSFRSVQNFRPPVIDSGEGLERYRKLSRFSLPLDTLDPIEASQYGYGQGIYIDNLQDKEKIFDTTLATPALREMTQSELTQMWLSQWTGTPATTPDFLRTGVPAAINSATASLEQKHLRGWVSPDEFRARGVEIELVGDSLVITRDARDETGARAVDNTWKNSANGNNIDGRYTHTFSWPANGVVFAEGNVRIKGIATNAPRSLTVVSMGSIYVEGDLGISSFAAPATTLPKVLLMAKKNVVMNPTRLMGSPDAFTEASQPANLAAGALGVIVQVESSYGFKKGDFIQAGPAQGYVSADPIASGNEKQLEVNVVTPGNVAPGNIISTPNALPGAVASTVPAAKNFAFTAVTNGTDTIQRRIALPATLPANVAVGDLRLAFNHQAERKTAATVAIQSVTGTPPANSIWFSNKGVFNTPNPTGPPNFAATVLGQGDRNIRGQYSDPNAKTDTFPATAPANENDARTVTTIESIFGVGGEMNKSIADHINNTPTPPDEWRYVTTTVADYKNLPFYYLAGVGNRVDFGSATVPADRRKDLNNPPIAAGATSNAYEVPLATSINVVLGGVNVPIYNEYWNTTLATPNYDRTNQFGFRPTFIDPAGAPADEDVLTSDQGFYRPDVQESTIDSRTPYDPIANPNGIGLGTSALVLRQSGALVQPVSATPPTPALPFPAYRLLGSKLENVKVATTVTAGVATTAVTNIGTPYTFNVNAFVYAQTGSWFVIPAPLFDERLRGTSNAAGVPQQSYLDLNNNRVADAGEFLDLNNNTTFDNGEFADLNRNGTLEDAEKVALLRYSRYNYGINFIGAIAENQTAVVNDVGTAVKGAVSEWMSKWATTTYVGPTPAAPATVAHGRIQYTFDPSVVQGDLVNDDGFVLPQTPELYNIT
jgi:hypothetical protein